MVSAFRLFYINILYTNKKVIYKITLFFQKVKSTPCEVAGHEVLTLLYLHNKKHIIFSQFIQLALYIVGSPTLTGRVSVSDYQICVFLTEPNHLI